MSDYYPEFYLRKRQREQAYRRATVITVGFLVLLALSGVVGYFVVNAVTTRNTPPGASPELAQQQQELQTQQQLADSSVPADVLENTAPAPSVDLGTVSYSESFPKVEVKLEGAAAKTEATDETAPADEQVPATGREPAANTDTDASAPSESQSDVANQTEAPKPSQQDTRVDSVTPTDDETRRKAEQAKRQEQAKREAQKREAAKRAAEEKKRDDAKKKAAEEEKAAKSDDNKDVRAPAKAGGYTYTVYGGTYLSSEDAEKDRAKLGAIGLSGNVIKTAGDYLLIVGRLDEEGSAAALANKLKGSGFGSAFVTRKAK